ncbi:MAG: HAAS signaling domain-containing protein [Gemmatimonadales bacterium]
MHRHATDPAVDRYLERVRAFLRGMPGPEIDDIVLELRSHIAERSGQEGGIEGALRSLGDPLELARQYRTEQVTARAECSRSPIVILHSLLLLRRRSVAGWVALALAAFGYAWAIVLGGAAIEKLLSPRDVGLWHQPGRASLPRLMVDGPGPPGTREMLGWWFVPLGIAACIALLYVTRQFALWWIRRNRTEK